MAATTASRPTPRASPTIRRLGLAEYLPTWEAMKAFTAARDAATRDEIWLVEHPPVFTLGQGAKPEHLLDPGPIPVIRIDRGGQVTYHGPGQAVIYLLLDLRRLGFGVKELVRRMEQAVIDLLAEYDVAAERRAGAPGVYVNGAKIAALGLRVRGGCCYHGLAFNVDMDLGPFRRINPCGYPGLAVTQARDLGIAGSAETLGEKLVQFLVSSIAGTR
ncbi:MAG TPA: lipoyl(octanoyl) transferase LipB [Burkholderiales bacterium]|nr:lipoyl(octanoyl) transferase LipB [Burkholderiales bacterium]